MKSVSWKIIENTQGQYCPSLITFYLLTFFFLLFKLYLWHILNFASLKFQWKKKRNNLLLLLDYKIGINKNHLVAWKCKSSYENSHIKNVKGYYTWNLATPPPFLRYLVFAKVDFYSFKYLSIQSKQWSKVRFTFN